MNANLTWFFDNSSIQNEQYIGSFESTSAFNISVTVINNYLGTEPCDEITNGRLLIMFKDYEDSGLLQHLQVVFDGSYQSTLEIVGNRAYAPIPKVISGDYDAPSNCTLTIDLSMNQNLLTKSDLKQLILDIVY